MTSPWKEGFLTEEQREALKIAASNADAISSSPRSPNKLVLPELYGKGGGCAPRSPTASGRRVRRSHSGKFVRVKKGESVAWNFRWVNSELCETRTDTKSKCLI